MSACPKEDEYEDGELMFIDGEQVRELTMRHNWRKDILDDLLQRISYCGKETIMAS